MANVIPFRAIRPVADKAHLVPSRSYASYSKTEMAQKLDTNPYTFLHVLRPEFGKIDASKTDTEEYLQMIRDRFEEFIKKGILIQDEKESFYLYRQIKNNHSYTGIIGCISIDDYFEGIIKKHEDTLSEREEKLKNYLEIVDINAEPVCFAYPDQPELNGVIEKTVALPPVYDFSTTNEIRHQLWVIEEPSMVEQVRDSFAKMNAVYIADGHHRSASSCLLGQEKRIISGRTDTAFRAGYFMSIFIPESQLRIMEFNRVVRELNGMSAETFLRQLEEDFLILETEKFDPPSKLHQMSMYLDGKSYVIEPKKGTFDESDPAKNLDAAILSKLVLGPLLGIRDIRNDHRIDFIGGHEGTGKLKKLVDSGKMKVAFALYPVTMEHLKKIADQNKVMPPKSTWIEPKLRSGLTIYSLSR